METDPCELPALAQWRLLQDGELTPTSLARHYLERIARLDPLVGAFATVTAERALERAAHVERAVPRTAPLWGLPLADKDLVDRAGVPSGYGSRTMTGHVPEVSSELVSVLDAAGTVSLGKTATPEFGMPSYTETLVGPPARTPWDLTRGAGGSSGGAAAAVAAGLVPFAPGSDGGGSIRIPAAACGLVGLKPSRGLVPSASGLASPGGLPVAGPIARTVADAALLLDGMLGRVNGRIPHPYAVGAPVADDGDYLGHAVRGEGRYQVGVMTTSAWDDAYDIVLAPEARDALEVALTALAATGHGLEEVALAPEPGYAALFDVLWQAGAARLPITPENEHLAEPLTRWLVARGRERSAGELAAALTAQAGFERRLIATLAPFDAVLTPAMADTPRPVGWWDADDPRENFAQQVRYTPYTSMVNVAGLPAIVLPVHVTAEGLPMGVQLIGRPGGEHVLLALGAQLERRLRWGDRRPPVWDARAAPDRRVR